MWGAVAWGRWNAPGCRRGGRGWQRREEAVDAVSSCGRSAAWRQGQNAGLATMARGDTGGGKVVALVAGVTGGHALHSVVCLCGWCG